jgi:tRNA(fMet)-specific endonuclease VapC
MKQALLDTDIISAFFRGTPRVLDNISKYFRDHNKLNLSIISYYEILNGLLYKDAQNQLKRFTEFSQLNNIIPLTLDAANHAAIIFATLKKTARL